MVLNSFSLTSWELSKPFVILCGLVNIGISTLASWGFILYIGIHEWQAINIGEKKNYLHSEKNEWNFNVLASVFLILGVGMDDAFIMLNSWQRHVSREKSVPQIMKETYEDAAVSITITSLTNIGSFTVGALVPSFYSVSNFCCYIATGLLFIYIWTLVFFGGILALSTRK